jgi:hypothetical protein
MSRSGIAYQRPDGVKSGDEIYKNFVDIMMSIKEIQDYNIKKRIYEYILAETKEASDELLKSVGDLKKKRY